MSDISVTATDTAVTLTAPYHPDFPRRARQLGGHFQGKDSRGRGVWAFDGRDEGRVRALAVEVYGTDGAVGELVTARVDLDQVGSSNNADLYFAGRNLARRPGRDDAVRLGEGVIVIAGGFPGSSGSMRHPDLGWHDGTTLEVRDLPKGHPDLDQDGVTVIEATIDVDALRAERARLAARIAEIDAVLGGA